MPLPIIMSNPTFGPSFGAMGALMYKLNSADMKSPPSKTSFMGMYGVNKSYSWWVSQDVFLKEDQWRLTMNLGSFYIPVKLMYEEKTLSYNEENLFLRIKARKRLSDELFVGMYYNYTPQNFTDVSDQELRDYGIEDDVQSSVGLMLVYDSRDYIYYPKHGVFSTAYILTNQEWIGASFNNVAFNYNFNIYQGVGDNDVLAARLNGSNLLGDTPYGALALYGVSSVDLSQVDLRGYMRGKYRGENQIDVQVEYRMNFARKLKRFGAVLNAGTGRIYGANYQEDLYDENIWLPSVGAGLRFNAIEKRHMNIRLDYNYGVHSNHAVYLGLFEAF